MASSFVIYVDEAGDEGFGDKASEWFVLSAVISRKNSQTAIWDNVRQTKLLIERPENKPLHFRDLPHCKCVAWTKQIRNLPLRTISILMHKPSLTERETFKKKYQLYRYTSRRRIERWSGCCKEKVKRGVGDGRAEVIFSNRSAMSYEELRCYWTKLRDDPSQVTSIEWNHLDLTKLSAVNSDQDGGLQIADCVASATLRAVTTNKWGDNEARYFQELLPRAYAPKEKILGCGVKIFPSLETIRPSRPHLSFLDGLK